MDIRWPGLSYEQWGGFDLYHTRFSGRPAPARPGSGVIEASGEDQENFAAGVETIRPDPQQAWWVPGAGEFVLPWDELLARTDPDAAALEFFTSTCAHTTALAGWDHSALELPRIPKREAS